VLRVGVEHPQGPADGGIRDGAQPAARPGFSVVAPVPEGDDKDEVQNPLQDGVLTLVVVGRLGAEQFQQRSGPRTRGNGGYRRKQFDKPVAGAAMEFVDAVEHGDGAGLTVAKGFVALSSDPGCRRRRRW
jgi:hypothetical protein